MGSQMLRVLGQCYEAGGSAFFPAGTLTRTFQGMADSAHQNVEKAKLLGSIARSAVAAKKINDAISQVKDTEGETKRESMEGDPIKSFEESLPVFLQTAWDMSAMDISSTASGVCNKLIKDVSVPWQLRVRRARALQRLGRIFLDASADSDLDPTGSAKQQLEEAFLGSIKQKGQK